jgi:hypothetical protein
MLAIGVESEEQIFCNGLEGHAMDMTERVFIVTEMTCFLVLIGLGLLGLLTQSL